MCCVLYVVCVYVSVCVCGVCVVMFLDTVPTSKLNSCNLVLVLYYY